MDREAAQMPRSYPVAIGASRDAKAEPGPRFSVFQKSILPPVLHAFYCLSEHLALCVTMTIPFKLL
jgi:hypothetical protein